MTLAAVVLWGGLAMAQVVSTHLQAERNVEDLAEQVGQRVLVRPPSWTFAQAVRSSYDQGRSYRLVPTRWTDERLAQALARRRLSCAVTIQQHDDGQFELERFGDCTESAPRPERATRAELVAMLPNRVVNVERRQAGRSLGVVSLTLLPLAAGIPVLAHGESTSNMPLTALGLVAVMFGPTAGPLYGGAGWDALFPVLGRAGTVGIALAYWAPTWDAGGAYAIVAIGGTGMLAADLYLGLHAVKTRNVRLSVSPGGLAVNGHW